MGNIAFKAYQFNDNPNPIEYNIVVDKEVNEVYTFLRNSALKDLRKMYLIHSK
jgi:hypothetical protein